MSRPLVSILIDTFNHERFIDQAISSALEQDFPRSDREIVVVDDGSKDGTLDQVEKWEPHVRVLSKPNGGQASAFNHGLAHCRGELIAFLDGDDWWLPHKLGQVVEQFVMHPDIGAVGHGVYESHSDRQANREIVPEKRCLLSLGDKVSAKLFTQLRWCLGTSRLTIRRSLVERMLPIPNELVVEADEWIFTLAPAMAPVVVLDKPLIHYRIHDRNHFHFSEGDENRLRTKRSVLECLCHLLPDRLRAAGVENDVIATVIEPLRLDSERIRLWVDGGRPWETFAVERSAYRSGNNGASVGYRAFNSVVLGLALVLPPRVFYQLRQWYSSRNLARYRRWVGEPQHASPVLTRKPAE